MEPLAFNQKPALKNYENHIMPVFNQFEAIPFKPGYKSDLWFRFIENVYARKDQWWYPTIVRDYFSSIELRYRNWIQVPLEEDELSKQRIARLIYRNDDITFSHEREVIQLEDFLGSIAGMYDLIMYFICFFFGSYIDFVARVKWIKLRYKFTDCCS